MTTRYREQPPLGRRLVQLRQRRRLSQAELARDSGLSTAVVQSIEQGRRQDPHLSTLLRLCQALHVTLQDLVDDGEVFLASLTPAPTSVSNSAFDRRLTS